jgi:hypothetical protein
MDVDNFRGAIVARAKIINPKSKYYGIRNDIVLVISIDAIYILVENKPGGSRAWYHGLGEFKNFSPEAVEALGTDFALFNIEGIVMEIKKRFNERAKKLRCHADSLEQYARLI